MSRAEKFYKEACKYRDNKEYELELEDNETVNDFLKQLPLSISMSELNGNEKYVYLTSSAGQIRTKRAVFIKDKSFKNIERIL